MRELAPDDCTGAPGERNSRAAQPDAAEEGGGVGRGLRADVRRLLAGRGGQASLRGGCLGLKLSNVVHVPGQELGQLLLDFIGLLEQLQRGSAVRVRRPGQFGDGLDAPGRLAAWHLLRPTTNHQRPPLASIRSSFVIRHSSFVTQWLNSYFALAWPARLIVGALPFLLWVAEISLWTAAPYWVLLLNGAFAGFWAGLFFCSVWPEVVTQRRSSA